MFFAIVLYIISGPITECSNPPTIELLKEPSDQIIFWNESVVLPCQVNYSKALYSWSFYPYDEMYENHHRGKPLQSGPWRKLDKSGNLILRHPQPHPGVALNSSNEDSKTNGLYQCNVKIAGYGAVLSRAARVELSELSVEVQPELLRQEEESFSAGGKYYPGQVVFLSCPIKIISTEKPLIRWFRRTSNGRLEEIRENEIEAPRDPYTYHALYLDNGRWLELQLGRLPGLPDNRILDSTLNESQRFTAGFGRYVCTAHLHAYNASGPDLLVQLASLDDLSVCEPGVQWAIEPRIIANTTGVQRVEMGTPSDSTIWLRTKQTLTLPCGSNAFFNGSANFVKSKGKQPDVVYYLRWKKEDELLVDESSQRGRFSLVGSGSLVLSDLTPTDSGNYRCEIVSRLNEVTPVLSNGIRVMVGDEPKLLAASGNSQTGQVQAEKQLFCNFSSNLPSRIEWRKNAEQIQNSQYFRIQTTQSGWSYRSVLTISGLLPNDAGYFQCFCYNRFGSDQATIALAVQPLNPAERYHSDQATSLRLQSPRNPRILSITESQAYISWLPSSITHEDAGLSQRLSYHVRVIPSHSSRSLTMNTTSPTVLLTDLRPDSLYDIEIVSFDVASQYSPSDPVTLHMRTKPMVYRPEAVTDLTADSGEFRTLNLSWRFPAGELASDKEKGLNISHYLITLFNLNPSKADPSSSRTTAHRLGHATPMQITVPFTSNEDSRYSHVVRDLTPDAFYQVSVQAVTVDNVTGHPAVISSSGRVTSRAPSEPPLNVRSQGIGAHVVTVLWDPPPIHARNGEIILYRLRIACDDWLRPKLISVYSGLAQLLLGLSPSTRYAFSVAAVTRGGDGPDSSTMSFVTAATETEADREASQSGEGYVIPAEENQPSNSASSVQNFPFPGSATKSHLRGVENLRYLGKERSLTVLWSTPDDVAGSHAQGKSDIDHYVIKWGRLYPGPDMRTVSSDQTSAVLQNLDTDATYHIEVSTVFKNGEIAPSMLTGRTRSVEVHRSLLIPLNLHAASVGSEWALLQWDATECEGNGQVPTDAKCLNQRPVQYYQVAYRATNNEADATVERERAELELAGHWADVIVNNQSFLLSSNSSVYKAKYINVTRPWVRLEQLTPGRTYATVVRAVGGRIGSPFSSDLLYSGWSLTEMFTTTENKPEDTPTDIQMNQIATSNGSVSVQLAWQPPTRSHGLLLGYVLYFTNNRQLSPAKWPKLNLPADSLNAVLHDLQPSSIYFIRMSARNRYGEGPLSAIHLYRTPDASGQGGGEIPLDRAYYEPLAIPDYLTAITSVALDAPREKIEAEANQVGIFWIMIGVLLGATLLISVILAAVFLRRQKKGGGRRGLKSGYPVDVDRTDSKSIGYNSLKRNLNNSLTPSMAQYVQSHHNARWDLSVSGPTTSALAPVGLTQGTYATNAPAGTGILLHNLHPISRDSDSWDHDSDSTPFVSVTQQRTEHGEVFQPLLSQFDHRVQRTPTQTASASSNSCAGSTDSPARKNPLTDPKHQHATYNSATLGALPMGQNMFLPHTPIIQTTGSPDLSNTATANHPHLIHYYQNQLGMANTFHQPNMLPYDGAMERSHMLPPNPPFINKPLLCNAYHDGTGYVTDLQTAILSRTPVYAVFNSKVTDQQHIGVNPPRVNASDLNSFTSSDDIRPSMTNSAHTDGGNIESMYPEDIKLATILDPSAARAPKYTSPSRTVGRQTRSNRRCLPGKLPSSQAEELRETVQKSSDTQSRILNGDSNVNVMKVKNGLSSVTDVENEHRAFSAEELSQEMANLEGLMKDLSAITRDEFK